jgi:hypothetical protein
MKRSLLFSSILFLGLAFVLTGCKKEELESSAQSTSTMATTGGVIVNVNRLFNWGGQAHYPASGATTRIATSLENIDRGIYLKEMITDGNGQVKFEQLLPGEYYINGFYSGAYFDIGQVQIIAGQTTQHEILFYW